MKKFQPIDIDRDFDNVQFDEESINRATAKILTNQDPQYKIRLKQAMEKVRQHPEYREKLKQAQQKLNQDPGHKQKLRDAQQLLKQNPQYQKNYSKAMQKLWQNEEWRKKQKNAADRVRNDPLFKEKKREEMKRNAIDPDFQKKRLQGHKKALEKESWIENVRKSKIKFRKKIQTPDGIFGSRKAAAEFYKIDPTMINRRMKNKPTEYFYIVDENPLEN